MKKWLKRNKRKLALILALSLLVTCVLRSYKPADAAVLPLDLLGTLVFEFTVYVAGMSAGEKSSDMVQENPYKSSDGSITENDARSNYIGECFPEDVFVGDFGWDQRSYSQMLASFSVVWANASYIMTKEYYNQVWEALKKKGENLSPEELAKMMDDSAFIKKTSPKNSPSPESSPDVNLGLGVSTITADTFAGIFSSQMYNKVSNALKEENANEMRSNLKGDEAAVCNYSVDYWKANKSFLSINSVQEGRTYSMRFNPISQYWDGLDGNAKLYPLSFQQDGVEQIGFAFSESVERLSNGISYLYSRNDNREAWGGPLELWFDKSAPIILPDLYNGVSKPSTMDIQHFLNLYKAKNVLVNGSVWDEYIIDVGTKENFDKWCEFTKSGNYTYAELLNLMKKGWIVSMADGEKQWEGENNPERQKETVKDPDIRKKYEDKRDADSDTDSDADSDSDSSADWKLSLDSLVNGMQENYDMPYGQPAYEFLGDPILKPETEPDTGADAKPETDPDAEYEYVSRDEAQDTWWGQNYYPSNDPEVNPEANPNPDTNPNPDPEKDPDNPDDGTEDPSKKPFTPQLDGDEDGTQWFERFPFCIPYDVYRVLGWFNAEKKAPKWSIPFKISRLDIDEKIQIDFTQFDNVIKVIRAFEILTYSFGLILITRNIIKG